MDKENTNNLLLGQIPNLSLTTEIRQYLSLKYLLKLLSSRSYFVRRKGDFEDINEGTLPKHVWFLPLLANSTPTEEELHNCITQHDKVKEYTDLADSFVSCWTINDREDMLMWKSYANELGVCIKTTINNFIAAFENSGYQNYQVYCAPVEYRKIGFDDDAFRCVFIKSEEFSSEKEIRFVFQPKQKGSGARSISLPCNPTILIDELILSPTIPIEFRNCLKMFFKDKFNIPVVFSNIKLK